MGAGSVGARVGGEIRLVLFGPPASGKGTQARRAATRLGVPHISSGALIRRTIERGDPHGIGREVAAGEKIDDVVVERILAPELTDGFILDGYPRTADQARRLDDLLAQRGPPLHAAVELRVDEDILRERMAVRARAEHRSDDRPEAFEHRLEEFERNAPGLRRHYEDRIVVEGEGAEEEVFDRLMGELGSRLGLP